MIPNFINYDYESNKIYQESATDSLDNLSDNDDFNGIIAYGETIAESAFIAEMPFKEIINGLVEQFRDYINIEDTTNYVDIFYNQFNNSIKAVMNNDEEDHPQEILEVLDNMKSKFIETIFDLFETRLTITIITVDDPLTEEDECEYVIRLLYEYFILNAKDNFKAVIAKNMIPNIGIINKDDEYYERIDKLLNDYDPLIRCITPTEFIQYTKNNEILELFENGQVAGNFLRKYSAKLYQNEEFKIDIITNITTIQNLKEDMFNVEQ